MRNAQTSVAAIIYMIMLGCGSNARLQLQCSVAAIVLACSYVICTTGSPMLCEGAAVSADIVRPPHC